MKMLFVCSANRLRSPTAEAVFSAIENIEALSAGTNHDAENPVSGDIIEWADIVFVMERAHRQKLQRRFGRLLLTKKIVVLGIPDDYDYMDTELIQILKDKVRPYLATPARAS
jgi:predicted protein tyrosine phosphatase